MKKLIYAAASVLALAAPHSQAWAQGQREQMQQWLNAHCWVNPASPECLEAVVNKQPVARPAMPQTNAGPNDLCPPPYFKLDARDGCIEVRRVRP